MGVRLISGGLVLASVLLAGAARAAVVDWSLQGVILSDGTAVTGTFDFDASTNGYSNVDIAVASGPNYPNATNFTVSIPVNGGNNEPYWIEAVPGTYAGDATGLEQIFLVFASPLTDAGGTVAIISEYGSPQLNTCGDPVCRTVDPDFPDVEGGSNQGVVTTEPQAGVPEPATWALMLSGFGLAGAALRRRRTMVAA
ncbi:MAG: PEP-CTERM sorting domain-containing protein [Phenylobacterium sp.]|nr:MAG: PEP-CTERM sorting domain-containing protein [Phenylobacterium sp.]